MKKTNNKNNITEIVFLLDRSASMSGLESDTIDGFNSLINEQKKIDGKCYVSTVLFDHKCEVIHDRVPINKINPITENEYWVRGCTALLDAVGGAVHHIGNIHKYARRQDVPSHTMFVIITDGMENDSRYYSLGKVKKMIERQENKYGWEFLFIGANIDAVSTASSLGVKLENAVNYHADSQGTETVFECVNNTFADVRNCGVLSPDWNSPISVDYVSRHSDR